MPLLMNDFSLENYSLSANYSGDTRRVKGLQFLAKTDLGDLFRAIQKNRVS